MLREEALDPTTTGPDGDVSCRGFTRSARQRPPSLPCPYAVRRHSQIYYSPTTLSYFSCDDPESVVEMYLQAIYLVIPSRPRRDNCEIHFSPRHRHRRLWQSATHLRKRRARHLLDSTSTNETAHGLKNSQPLAGDASHAVHETSRATDRARRDSLRPSPASHAEPPSRATFPPRRVYSSISAPQLPRCGKEALSGVRTHAQL